jgi:hypothetical protein
VLTSITARTKEKPRRPIGGFYPMMAARLVELAPGRVWHVHQDFDESALTKWRILQGRRITDVVPARGGDNSQRQIAPFQSDGMPCFAFVVYLGSVVHRGDTSDRASRQQV